MLCCLLEDLTEWLCHSSIPTPRVDPSHSAITVDEPLRSRYRTVIEAQPASLVDHTASMLSASDELSRPGAQGPKPAQLPIEQPTDFELAAAPKRLTKALGLTVLPHEQRVGGVPIDYRLSAWWHCACWGRSSRRFDGSGGLLACTRSVRGVPSPGGGPQTLGRTLPQVCTEVERYNGSASQASTARAAI
jgi:hypothetical protein